MEAEKAPEAPPAAPAKGRGMWIGVVVVAIVIVILLAAVFGGLLGTPPAPTEKDKVLKIGTVLTLTGTSGLEVFGPKNQRGALLAVAEINAAGGVLGNNITIVNEDDTGVEATARARAQKLVTSDRVDAILGAVGSAFCQQVLAVTEANGVVQISASCTSPVFSNLTYTGGWFFRTAPSDALQGVVAANYSYVDRGFRTMGVIGNDNAYGRGLANVFADKFRAYGGTATVQIFALGSTSYNSELTALISGTPGIESIYMANYPTDGLRVMQDWYANPAWANISWVFSEGVLEQAGFVDRLYANGIDANASGFQGSAPGAYLGVVGPLFNDFKTRYMAANSNEDPGLFTANAYDAVYLLAAAAQKAGEATAQGIKDNIRAVAGSPGSQFHGGQWAAMRAAIDSSTDVDYDGASGAVNLDTYGDPLSGYGIWGVNITGKIITLKTYDESTVVAMTQGAPPMPVGTRSGIEVDWSATVRMEG